MPHLPGSGDQQLALLSHLFAEISRVEGAIHEEVDLGSGNVHKLGDLVSQIQPCGLVHMADRQHCAPTPEAMTWLESGDPVDLLVAFHRNNRFVGEMLSAIHEGANTTSALRTVANEVYLINWTTRDQVRRRITWFTNLGFTEYRTATEIVLTSAGVEILSRLTLGAPDLPPEPAGVVDIPTLPDVIAAQVADLTPARLMSRELVLGYVPRGGGEMDIVGSFLAMTNAASVEISRADYIEFQKQLFSSAESSFGATLTTLTKTGLVDQVARDRFMTTQLGQAWLEAPTALHLALIVHSRYRFVLEILPLLDEYPDAPSLARVGHSSFGLTRVDSAGVRTRLQILKAAGLVYERGAWKYKPTSLGLSVLKFVASETPGDPEESTPKPSSESFSVNPEQVLAKELEAASTAAETPDRLEVVVTDALTYLGFDARRIGGSGQTDVLAVAFDEANNPVRVIVDAKAARSGSVQESAVSFDTLREHREAHRANLVVLVGPGFEAGRIKKRAADHQVTLMTTRELGQYILRHAVTPQSAYHYLGLLSPELDDQSQSDNGWARAERRLDLLSRVVGVLAEEAAGADTVTGGALTLDQIYLIVREAVDPRPSPGDIESALQFLEHPVMACVVGSTGQGRTTAYRLVDPPSLVVDKLRAVAAGIDSLSGADSP